MGVSRPFSKLNYLLGKTCTTVEEVTKISCKKITIDADISRWFTDPLLDAHRLTLAVADGNLTIQNSLVYSIKLPQLVTVKSTLLLFLRIDSCPGK